MKLLHLADLHIGKRVYEFSMIDDQKYILDEILSIIDNEQPDGIMIAGDIYDKTIPSAEAVILFDEFIAQLSKRKIETFIISGNHDSPERLAFGNRLMDNSGIHFSSLYKGSVKPFYLKDEYGTVALYMLPFLKPVIMKHWFPQEEIRSYNDAVKIAIREMNIDPSARNILIAHQFVTGAECSDSEELSIGGLDNIDSSLFKEFDYVALGHIHGPQKIGSEKIRYSGSPLKYSFSETRHKKSVTVIELKEKGSLTIHTVPLIPKRDFIELKGTYEELTARSFYKNTTYDKDYVHITLTNEDDIPEALTKLRVIYHNLMKLDYDNIRTRHKEKINGIEEMNQKSPIELFSEFYKKQNGTEMNEEQKNTIECLMRKIWEEN